MSTPIFSNDKSGTEDNKSNERKCLNCNEPCPSNELFCCFPCNHGYKTRIFNLFHQEFKPTLRSLDN